MTASKDKYCVFGNPIEHSKSPVIHTAFAKETEQKISYTKQLVELSDFESKAREFFKAGGKGLNVTVPFKLEAFEFADTLTEQAKTAGAVNTLALQSDGRVLGENTDGAGLVTDITKRLRWNLKGKRILVIGAGGAVRGVLLPLLRESPACVYIANRTESKAWKLASEFSDYGNVAASGFEGVDQQFDVVINGSSASLSGEVPPIPEDCFAKNACAYDMAYGNQPTVFMKWAKEHGAASVADGLGMLVGQAALSFQLWRGVNPKINPVISLLKKVK